MIRLIRVELSATEGQHNRGTFSRRRAVGCPGVTTQSMQHPCTHRLLLASSHKRVLAAASVRWPCIYTATKSTPSLYHPLLVRPHGTSPVGAPLAACSHPQTPPTDMKLCVLFALIASCSAFAPAASVRPAVARRSAMPVRQVAPVMELETVDTWCADALILPPCPSALTPGTADSPH